MSSYTQWRAASSEISQSDWSIAFTAEGVDFDGLSMNDAYVVSSLMAAVLTGFDPADWLKYCLSVGARTLLEGGAS